MCCKSPTWDAIARRRRAWLTPDSFTGDTFLCRQLMIPDDPDLVAAVGGALALLGEDENWEQFGTMTPAEAAQLMRNMLFAYYNDACGAPDLEAPFWDDENADDADGEEDDAEESGFPWYEDVADWIVTAFLAVSFGPAAAIKFVTAARTIRLAFRTQNYGAIFDIFIDEEQVASVDTYSPVPGQDFVDIFMDAPTGGGFRALDVGTPRELRIVHSGTHNASATATEAGYGIEIIRKRLWAGEVSPANIRYSVETDGFQFSPDRGTTWYDQPAVDPRHSDTYRRPALSGEDAKCDAAARIVAAWQELLELLYASTSAAQFVTGVLEILVVLTGPVGWLIDVIVIALEALITIGIANIQAAFTGEVWDGIECIIFNHIGEDGQVSAAQREAILADIADQYPGVVYGTLQQVQFLFGEVLMSNAGIERSETSDCTSCVCDCGGLELEAGIVGTVESLGDCKWRITGTESHRGPTTDYEVFVQRVGGGAFMIVNFEYVYGAGNIDFTAYEAFGGGFTAGDPMGQCVTVAYYLDDDPDPVASGEWQAIITACEC